MDQLASNLQTMFKTVFGAEVSNLKIAMQNNAQPVYLMGGGNGPVGFNNMATETHLSFTVFETENASVFKDNTSHGVYNFMRKGLFDIITKDCAILQNMRVSKDISKFGYVTELELLVGDIDKFSLNLKNYEWKAYSDKFDELMENKLSE